MSGATYGDVVLEAIRAEYGPLKHAAEYLGRAAGASPRTAESWLAGVRFPSGEKLLNLMAACERVHDAVVQASIERRATLRTRARAAADYARTRKQ
jgi:hypothetical protein